MKGWPILMQNYNMVRISCIQENNKMCVGEFSDIVKICLKSGITQFDLTPIRTDPFLDPHINERINLLSSNNEVKKIRVFTNMLKEGPIFSSIKCPKLELNVVVYGNTRSLFKSQVGSDMYGLFIKNFRTLVEYVYNNPELKKQLIIRKRFRGRFNQPNLDDYNDLSRWILYSKKMNIQMIDNTTTDLNDAEICIFPGGDIKVNSLTIGNIHRNQLLQ